MGRRQEEEAAREDGCGRAAPPAQRRPRELGGAGPGPPPPAPCGAPGGAAAAALRSRRGEKIPQTPTGHGEAPPAPAMLRQPQFQPPRAPRDRPGGGWSAAPRHPKPASPEITAPDTFLVPAASEIPRGNCWERLCPTFPVIFTSCSRQGGSGALPQRPPGPGPTRPGLGQGEPEDTGERPKVAPGEGGSGWISGEIPALKDGLGMGRGCGGVTSLEGFKKRVDGALGNVV